jgi:hypothetical protein
MDGVRYQSILGYYRNVACVDLADLNFGNWRNDNVAAPENEGLRLWRFIKNE